jgi:cell division protein FtsB
MPASPPAQRAIKAPTLARTGHPVGRYPGWRETSIAFPGPLFQAAPVADRDGCGESLQAQPLRLRRDSPPLTVAGAAQVGLLRACAAGSLLPVELRHVNHTASTNILILKRFHSQFPTIRGMASGSNLDPLVERVERLLVRYEELQRTNTLLAQQVDLLTQERDSLKSRLSAARARVDALLERLPDLNTPA